MSRRPTRPGLAMLAVIVVIALCAMLAAGLLHRMRAESAASVYSGRSQQAYAAAVSGVHQAIALLRQEPEDRTLLYDNPEVFQNRIVRGPSNRSEANPSGGESASEAWVFTVWAADPLEADGVRFGLTDLGGLLDLNTAEGSTLARLPGMDAAVTDALLDWRDPDDEPRPQGAEQPYYDGLPEPYRVRNGPLTHVEQLLAVRGFTGSVVLGEDVNRSARLEPNEDDGDERFPPDDADGVLDPGLVDLLSVGVFEPNVDAQGQARINLNGDLDELMGELEDVSDLPEQTLAFIELFRREGNTFTDPSQLLGMTHRLSEDHGPDPGQRAGDEIDSGVGARALSAVLDRLSVSFEDTRTGRVNAHTAPVEVLAALPGLDEADAERILDVRGRLGVQERTTVAWLVERGVLEPEAFRAAAPKLTARGYFHRVRSVGFQPSTGVFRVVEAVIDSASDPERPRIMLLRELTAAGVPLPLSLEASPGRF